MTASGKRPSEHHMHGSFPAVHARATIDPSAVMVPKAPPLASIHLAHDPLPTPGHHTAAESLANTRRPQRPDHRVPWQEPGDRNERAGGSLPWSPTTSAWPQPQPGHNPVRPRFATTPAPEARLRNLRAGGTHMLPDNNTRPLAPTLLLADDYFLCISVRNLLRALGLR